MRSAAKATLEPEVMTIYTQNRVTGIKAKNKHYDNDTAAKLDFSDAVINFSTISSDSLSLLHSIRERLLKMVFPFVNRNGCVVLLQPVNRRILTT